MIPPANILFLHDLSPDEIEEVKTMEQVCKQFINEASAWEDNRVKIFKERG